MNTENRVLATLLQASLQWCLHCPTEALVLDINPATLQLRKKAHTVYTAGMGRFRCIQLEDLLFLSFFLRRGVGGGGWTVVVVEGEMHAPKFFLQVFILKNFKLQKNCKNNAFSQTLSLLAFCHICTLSIDHNFANPFENYLETLY